jgi:antitoxin YefM
MELLNYIEFKKNLAASLNKVNDDAETLFVSRGKGKNIAVMALDEYNAIMETLHITKSPANRKRLDEAIDEMKKGKYIKRKLAKT